MASPVIRSTLCEAFQATASIDTDAIALRTPGGTQQITWGDYASRVRAIAEGLASLGVRRGDTVGIMLTNRPEFNLCDTAAIHLGATPFSVYNTSSPEQIAFLFKNAGCRVVIYEQQFSAQINHALPETDVETLVCIDGGGGPLLDLAGLESSRCPGFDFEASWRAVAPDDVLTLIYTSGTTGPPKGVELTHANLLAELDGLAQLLPIEHGDRITSYLPAAHIADRMSSHYFSLVHGVEITTVADAKQVVGALLDCRPTIWAAVPRIWEKLKVALESGGITDPQKLSEPERSAVLAKIGLDQARWAFCGAAPIPPDVLTYFADLGLPVLEIWGMSELSCAATLNPIDDVRIGTVGRPLPGVSLRLADDGEVLVRGATVMRGYRGRLDLTAETIDRDGWLATGDLGTLDEDGYLSIVDRKKEIIINAAGKNMSPANIEQTLKSSSPLIDQAVVIGDARPFNVALLVLELQSSVVAADLEERIADAIEAANARLSRVEQIKRYRVLPGEWEPGGDELTPTSKLKRKAISTKYAAVIEELYAN